MLHERRSEIIEKIRQNRMVKVADLIQEYNVSIETIRRDLEYLEKKGYLKRVYGGAVLHGLYGEEPAFEHREIIHSDEKQSVARCAADYVEDGDTLFVDVGTTVLETVQCLPGKKGLTIITNSMLSAQAALRIEGCRIILLGGVVRAGEQSVSGFLCDTALQNFFANKFLMGAGGISVENGVTDYHVQEANARRIMIDHSDKVILIADSSKIGVTAMNYICPVTRITTLVTDWSAPQKALSELRAKGVEICATQKE